MRPDHFLQKIQKSSGLVIASFFVFVAFFYKGLFAPDPDFGWHVRLGDLIRRIGIPHTDPFSYTMASYPFVDHEWFTNVWIAFFHGFVGTEGLLVFFALIATGTMIAITSWVPSKLRTPFLILGASILIPFAGVRPQVVVWMFFAVFLRALDTYEKNSVVGWFVPAGVLVWANSHGSFPIALVLLVIFFAVRLWQKKGLSGRDVFVILGSAAATVITPYGWRSWWEVWMQMTDGGLRWSINEWMPMLFYFDLALLLFIALAIVDAMKLGKVTPLWRRIVFWVFFIGALTSIRHIPLLIIAAFPIIGSGLTELFILIKGPGGEKRKKIVIRFLQVCILICCTIQLALFFWTYIKQGGVRYPDRAVEYIKKNPVPGRVFSVYDWGGYLIWKLPGERVFIDGRMPSWRRQNAPNGESVNAMKDYQSMMRNPAVFRRIIAQYHITRVLLPKNLIGTQRSTPSFINKWFFRWDPKQPTAQDFLRGMTKEYADDTAFIYRVEALR